MNKEGLIIQQIEDAFSVEFLGWATYKQTWAASGSDTNAIWSTTEGFQGPKSTQRVKAVWEAGNKILAVTTLQEDGSSVGTNNMYIEGSNLIVVRKHPKGAEYKQKYSRK